MLEAAGIYAGYGKKQVLVDVSLEVPDRAIISVIGPNGAGKSTLLRTLMGLTDLYHGKLLFENTDISRTGTRDRIRAGIRLAPQGAPVFGGLTVRENLEVAASRTLREADVSRLFGLFSNLHRRADVTASVLSGGERQMLAIAMALASEPSLLLLDEPSGGLAPAVVNTVFEHIQRINRELGLAVLLVEQNVRQAVAVSRRIYVMKGGRVADIVDEPDLESIQRLTALA